MIDLTVLVILSLAVYRITRFLLFDTIISTPREKYYGFLAKPGKLGWIREKFLELSTCFWCSAWWVTLGTFSVWQWVSPLELTTGNWLSVLAVSASSALIRAYEPE